MTTSTMWKNSGRGDRLGAKGICMKYLFVAAFLFFTTTAQAAEFAGYVREVSGDVTIDRGAGARPLHKGDDIAINDTIKTEKGGRAKIEFADGAELVLAQRGSLKIEQYVYDPKKPHDGKAEMTVLDSAFSFTGGWMDKGDKSDVKMNLNFGTIGVRGTKIMRAMNMTATGKECWIYLQSGHIDVYNKGGKVSLNPGEGTIMSGKTTAPAAPHIWPKKEIAWISANIAGEAKEWKP